MPGSALTRGHHEGLTTLDGRPFYVIADVDALDPFLMSVIGSTDVWLFMASNGALTAGRRDPNHAIFPYYTEDKLIDGVHDTGGVTLIRGPWGPSGDAVWEVGARCDDGLGPRTRWIAKSTLGDELVLGEDRPDLGLGFQVSWTTSARFGLVRRCRLTADATVGVRVLDGLRNLLPAEIERQTQNELSVLLDAYKRSEIVAGLGIFSLSSRLTDLAAPSEALRATVAWRLGPPADRHSASGSAVERFRADGAIADALDARGVRSAYLTQFEAHPAPDAPTTWTVVADTALDTAAVHDLAAALRDPDALASALASDLDLGRRRFTSLLAGCDSAQLTGDDRASAHHVASTAFSAMRGGVPLDGHRLHRDHVRTFLRTRNRDVAAAHAAAVDALADVSERDAVVAWGAASGDPDLERLTLEFLPLTFGRRHGDPSRPWNRFEIVLTDASGAPAISYQGNWRDIFQNWEALAWSYPAYVEGMVATFVDATTIDGYNPYRLTHTGVDWEEPEPDNPWANIGYWSDHQIVYLDRLLQASQRLHPGALGRLLDRQLFTTADVPYRIAGLDATLADPYDTIAFDAAASADARARGAALGGDGLLRRTADGGLHRSTLADKLVLLLAAKMANFVPDAGIWMNTQRPEWNDANNALVGHGASVVTTAQLLPFVERLAGLIGDRAVRLRPSLLALVDDLTAVLDADPDAPRTPESRMAMLRSLGRAGERYRTRAYAERTDATVGVPAGVLQRFLASSSAWLRATLDANRRPDGLFHSYNTIAWDAASVDIARLPLMLEGQVAVLGSGLLDAAASVALSSALRTSPLYRADQHSYLLYPDRDLPGFLDRNRVAAPSWASLPALLADPRRPVVRAGGDGVLHFAPDLANAQVLSQRLAALAAEPAYAATLADDTAAILAAYEDTFGHRSFTGRSQSFFAYEGLGSVYWHMVSKLALAVRESVDRARDAGAPDELVAALTAAYRDVRAGLGFSKSAAGFGAFPLDPYSHTPAHAGARQPGMTGQVKEDILNRLWELGLRVVDGVVSLDRRSIDPGEWVASEGVLRYLDADGRDASVPVPAGALAFTFCQVPFVVGRGDGVTVVDRDGVSATRPGEALALVDSASVLARDGRVRLVYVGVAEADAGR